MHYFDAEGMPRREDVPTDVYLPVWLSSPYLKAGKVNENILQRPNMTDAVSAVMEHDKAVLGGFMMAPAGDISAQNRQTAEFATLRSISEGQEVSYLGDPISNLLLPLFSHFEESIRQVSSIMLSTIHWRSYLRKFLLVKTNLHAV